MPTYEAWDRFKSEYRHLSMHEQQLFRDAREQFVQTLVVWEREHRRGAPEFPKKLGVTPMVGRGEILELAWAPDGRCTWHYGTSQIPGKYHIVWRRIGSHTIYEDP